VLVYVYLYNAQGITFKTWQKMIGPGVFYEYSVNRPIYREQGLVESFIRSKANKQQHAYLVIAIKKEHILSADADSSKDAINQPLIKVKEGELKINRLISFNYNGHEYVLNEAGTLIKKD
jgi:hypothetical protein